LCDGDGSGSDLRQKREEKQGSRGFDDE